LRDDDFSGGTIPNGDKLGCRSQARRISVLTMPATAVDFFFDGVRFYLIEKFVRDGRLANLLKILGVLICALQILRMLLPILGLGGLL